MRIFRRARRFLDLFLRERSEGRNPRTRQGFIERACMGFGRSTIERFYGSNGRTNHDSLVNNPTLQRRFPALSIAADRLTIGSTNGT
jgi:hypothetical protein